MKVWPGHSDPLGATYDGAGTNFSLFSEVATGIDLCLFDDDGEERVPLTEVTNLCWHGYLPGIGPGQRYGFRVHGPWDPLWGLRCQAVKLLLDPYAKAVEGGVDWAAPVYGHQFGGSELIPDHRDSAPYVPRSVVTDPFFDWGRDVPPRTPWHETIIYELNVKGFTARHRDIEPPLRGTFAGLASAPVLDHLVRLGVTAVELMPVHQFIHDDFLVRQGLRNYWGYNSIAYFAPHNEYAASGQRGEQVNEFKRMVAALHGVGLEVILDVVYTHTAETDRFGPTLSFRGLDNPAYYRLQANNRRRYVDYTGTGNTLNVRNPYVLWMIMDSLRYWVTEMHVDGFRFDLAAALARELQEVDRLSAFFDLMLQDPVLSQVKLIAEPWDVGEGGDYLGNFPPGWSEWNRRYRDVIRDFWRGATPGFELVGAALTGSSDLYQPTGRRPQASLNYVTCHDGFTLHDLVSYSEKHNEANGEDNRDGEVDNRSWNCGIEGPTADDRILALRRRQQRNLLTTLFVSQGVPMILYGDEFGRTQNGNNNAYCQDNEMSWIDWSGTEEQQDLCEEVARLGQLRRSHPVFQRISWLIGRPFGGSGRSDVAWFDPDGVEILPEYFSGPGAISPEDCSRPLASFALFLNGEALPGPDQRGERIVDDSFLLLFNASEASMPFRLPSAEWADRWMLELRTDRPAGCATSAAGAEPVEPGDVVRAGQAIHLTDHSLIILRSAV